MPWYYTFNVLFHFSFCQILFFIEVGDASPILNYSGIKLHKHWCNWLISSAFTLIEFVYMGILPLILMIPGTGCSVNSPLVFEYYFNGLICRGTFSGLPCLPHMIELSLTSGIKLLLIHILSGMWEVSFLRFFASSILKSNILLSNPLDSFRIKWIGAKVGFLAYVILYNQSVL